jgi:hypothetical protein
LAAAERPNFAGTWKLNNLRSTQDGPADRVYVLMIEQQGVNVKVTTKSEGVTNILDGAFKADGKPRVAKVGNNYRYTTVEFQNATLVFDIIDKDSKKDTARAVMEVRDAYTLSPDGKVLTRFRRTGGGGKVVDQKYVFDKQ